MSTLPAAARRPGRKRGDYPPPHYRPPRGPEGGLRGPETYSVHTAGAARRGPEGGLQAPRTLPVYTAGRGTRPRGGFQGRENRQSPGERKGRRSQTQDGQTGDRHSRDAKRARPLKRPGSETKNAGA